MELDAAVGNNKWAVAHQLQMEQIREYEVFIDKGIYHMSKIPRGFQQIQVHVCWNCKYDGRHKCHLVRNGNLTDVPVDSVYSGVVSLRRLRMCLFLAELNGMGVYATDIGNAYLEAYTTEKLVIHAGKEFGELENNLLIDSKSLYGLRSSGLCFNELLGTCLGNLEFEQSKCESDIWIRDAGDCYKYVGTYVDDLITVCKDPQQLLDKLRGEPFKFKLKGLQSIDGAVHLSAAFSRDKDGVLTMNPSQYIKRIEEAYNHRSPDKAPDRKVMSIGVGFVTRGALAEKLFSISSGEMLYFLA